MATYAKPVFDHGNYQAFRPTYPNSFYNTVLSYHGDSKDTFLDVGCGTGQATFPLSAHFQRSIGVDPSDGMISKCKSMLDGRKIEFQVGKAEDLNMIQSGSIDLLTAAECVHWMDPAGFLDESARVLSVNGTLAFWLYVEPVFQHQLLNDIYLKYTRYDPDYMKPYWDKGKERYYAWLKDTTDLLEKDQRFENVELVKFEQATLSATKREEAAKTGQLDNTPILLLQKDFTLDEFVTFVNTYSALPGWYKDHEGAKGTENDIMFQFKKELVDSGVWGDSQHVVWDTMYCFAKKK